MNETIFGILPLLWLRPKADKRGKLVPLSRRHAIQAKFAMVVDRTVYRAALILMYAGSNHRCLGWPHRPGEHPRDAIRAALAHGQTVALPLVLFQEVLENLPMPSLPNPPHQPQKPIPGGSGVPESPSDSPAISLTPPDRRRSSIRTPPG